jgi:hypothetical protein
MAVLSDATRTTKMQNDKTDRITPGRVSFADLNNIPPRRRLKLPIIHSDNAVTVTGEALHPILWQGRQWAVTHYGVECRDGTYVIEKDDLRKGSDDGRPSWEDHMAEKNWVDLADFATAMAWARSYFASSSRSSRSRPGDLKPGDTIDSRGQVYKCVAVGETPTSRGTTARLWTLEARCADCGEPFRVVASRAMIRRREFNRRCDKHKRPGTRTRFASLRAQGVS